MIWIVGAACIALGAALAALFVRWRAARLSDNASARVVAAKSSADKQRLELEKEAGEPPIKDMNREEKFKEFGRLFNSDD